MFSTDFIFRQQENLVETRNVRLNSGNYATKYYYPNSYADNCSDSDSLCAMLISSHLQVNLMTDDSDDSP